MMNEAFKVAIEEKFVNHIMWMLSCMLNHAKDCSWSGSGFDLTRYLTVSLSG